MRQMFRKEYTKELEETQQALESKTLDEVAADNQRRAATAPPAVDPRDLSGPTGPSSLVQTPTAPVTTVPQRLKTPTAPPQQPIPTSSAGSSPTPNPDLGVQIIDEEKPKGFFASLFKRKK
jgi:hypothetical protein